MAIQFTANFALPYPQEDRSDTADVPRDIKALAVKVDTELLVARHDELIGEVKIWPIAAAPANFLICDGSLVDRAGVYNDLFLVIGTTFNTGGEAGDKFRLPDLRGRVPVGVDGVAGRLDALDALGNAGGAQKHLLSSAEMPLHNHAVGNHQHGPGSMEAVAAGAHTHGGPYNGEFAGFSVAGPKVVVRSTAGAGFDVEFSHGTDSNIAGSHGHILNGLSSLAGAQDTTGTGGGATHNNMQPYQIVNFIIRYA